MTTRKKGAKKRVTSKMRTKRSSDGPGSLLGKELRKLQPKLRMIANGTSRVNALRAVRSSCIGVTDDAPDVHARAIATRSYLPVARQQLRKAERGKQRQTPRDIVANVFIQLTSSKASLADLKTHAKVYRRGSLVTAQVRLSELKGLMDSGVVSHVELGDPIASPRPVINNSTALPPDETRRRFDDNPLLRGRRGKVLIGIIDVQGFDFSHPDFLETKDKTRFVRIWDQGGEGRPSPKKQGTTAFAYGAEFRRAHLNDALKASRQLNVPAFEIEQQSQLVVGSHGTHVASIAAGNHGICNKAPIAGVLISLPREDSDRRKSFYDSTRLAHAVEYLLAVADEMRIPVSINISLGTNGHAHDASSAVSRWIDSALATPGRCVSVAAGNAGQEAAEFEGDRGYVMGRIHTSGQVPARGLTRDIEWIVAGNGIQDISENELEIWYGPQDRFEVSVLPPGPNDPTRWIGPVLPGQYIENKVLSEHEVHKERQGELGGSVVSIYNELYHPANGSNYISVYLSPFFAEGGSVGIPAGAWTVRLRGHEVRDGRFHGWIERDDPRPRGRQSEFERWSFPSFFAENSNVDDASVSSLACGHWIVSVANLDDRAGRINVSSSQGPTRDNRNKPDVAAPGTSIVAAKGFAGPDDRWIEMTGTSMASPYVAGVAGLMLCANPKLTAAQISGIMQRTSLPLPGGQFTWANDSGFGVIDPTACLAEAASAGEREDLNASGRAGNALKTSSARRKGRKQR